MKKKKARMIKAPILFLVIILLGICIYYTMKSGKVNEITNTKKLENLGYSTSIVSIIEDNKDYLDYALSQPYNEDLEKFIKEEDFDITNIDAYSDYLKNNENAVISDIIYLVNNGITYTYSNVLMSIVKEKYFLVTRLERYMNYANDYPSLTSNKVVTNVNCNLDYDYYTNITPTDTSLGKLMIANKYYALDKDYENDLVVMDNAYTRVAGAKMNKEAYEYFKKMSDAAALENLSILNQSAYRSYYSQLSIYNDYLNRNGQEWTDRWSARAGHSEHQTGLASDVLNRTNTTLDDFKNTSEYTWMKNNSYKYGFILRYTADTTLQTGYGDEPWHYRYVGVDAAKTIYEEKISFDEYYTYYVLKK